MFFWTDTPQQEIWRQLRYLTSQANVARLLDKTTKSGRKLGVPQDLEARAADISFCIRQADEYFHAAANTSLATSPLLYFYGTQVISKALVLACDYNTSLSDIKYHGLNSRPSTSTEKTMATSLQTYSATPSAWNMEEEFAIASDGLFQKLCNVVGDTPSNGSVLRFKDILACTPDLREIYRRHYNEPGRCFRLYEMPVVREPLKLEIKFGDEEDPEHLIATFPELGTDFDLHKHQGYIGFIEKTKGQWKGKPTGMPVEGTIADTYMVLPINGQVHRTTPVIFAGLFILSQVVRYKPSLWQNVLKGETSGSVTMAEQFCGYAQRRLLQDVLRLIWGEPFTFATPGYIS